MFVCHIESSVVLERRGGGDAGVGDEDVDAAIFDAASAEGARDGGFLRHVKHDAAHRVLSVRCAEVLKVCSSDAASMSARTTQAPSRSRRCGTVPRRCPPAPPVTKAIRAGEALRLRHPLQLRLLEQPVFDVERFLLRQPDSNPIPTTLRA